MKKGTLTSHNVHLRDHEYLTVKLLLEQGYDIELIPPSQIKGLKMPDIMMQGVPWEIKAPTGDGRSNIKHILQKALHQCDHIIIDLRRSKLEQDKAILELQYFFKKSKRIRHLKIVTKTNEILDFHK